MTPERRQDKMIWELNYKKIRVQTRQQKKSNPHPYRKYLIFMILFWSFASCDSNVVFENYKTVGNQGWHKDSAIMFTVDLQDTMSFYNVYLDIRNKGNYPNSNIWLFVNIRSPEEKLLTDTVELILADHSGKWRGSGIGDLFDNQFLYQQNLSFPVAGKYEFSVRQGMRTTKLQGIQDVGIRLEKRP